MAENILPQRIIGKTIERFESDELSFEEDWSFIELLFQETVCLAVLEKVKNEFQKRQVFLEEKDLLAWYQKIKQYDLEYNSNSNEEYQHGFLFEIVGEIIEALDTANPGLLTSQQAS